MIERLARGIDRRLDAAAFARDKTSKVFPESWTFLFGEVAMYAFAVLVISGIFLALFFDASMTETHYTGVYDPLVGAEMSAAYRSVIHLSFDVRGGLLVRQIHHWSAIVFLASIVVHLLRVFFTGAFRRPREINWIVGAGLLLLALAEGFAGYSVLDDVLSGVGLRITHGIIESIPVVGAWLASFVFGGPFPGDQIIGRLYVAHVFLLPAAITALITIHLALIVRQSHTQFPGAGRREDNVVGLKVWPGYAARSVGLFMLVAALLTALGGFVQINPVWLWGPFDPYLTTTAAQPDWYVGWLEGALRLFPPWEPTVFGVTIPNPFFPAVVLPAACFGLLFTYPWLEQWATGDRAEHHLLDRARDRPGRVAVGVAAITFVIVILTAGSQDILAVILDVPLRPLVWTLRIAVLALPPITGLIAYLWARDLGRGSRPVGEHAFLQLEHDLRDGDPHSTARAPSRQGHARAITTSVVAGGVLGGVIGRRLASGRRRRR